MNELIAAEIPRLKRASITVAVAGSLAMAFALVMLTGIIFRDHDRPQFPYEIAIALCVLIYFSALTSLAVRAVRFSSARAQLHLTLRYLSQSVIGLFVPIGLLMAFLIWLIFQPTY